MDVRAARRMRRLGLWMLVITFAALIIADINLYRGIKLMESYGVLLPFVFMGIMLMMPTRPSLCYWPGFLWIVWFIVSRVLLGDPYFIRTGIDWFAVDCITFIFILPFAWFLQDGQRKHGLFIVAGMLFTALSASSWLALICGLMGKPINVPYLGGYFGIGQYEGNAYRLTISPHPNISGALIVVGIMLGVWLLATGRCRRWMYPFWGIMFIGLYVALALTMSRTCIILMALFAAMMLVLLLLHKLTKRTRARWLKAIGTFMLGAVVLIVAFQSSYWILNGFNSIQNKLHAPSALTVETATETTAAVASEADPSLETERPNQVKERPIQGDLTTMTGRTNIYRTVIQMLIENPKMLLLGTTNRADTLPHFAHAHNAYLQVAICLGLPALLLALWFSVHAVWLCGKLLFCHFKKATAGDLILICSILVLLVGAIPEPHLFFTIDTNLIQIVFFLLYGYLIETERRLRAA